MALTEANAVLWHATPAALSILKDDSFQLTFAGGTESDNRHPNRQFYLSCSRIPHGGYSMGEYYKNTQFKFQLDGQQLAHRFRIIPVRYWGDLGRDDRSRDENEDRIVSNNHEIRPASKYITALHVFVPTEDDLSEREIQRNILLQITEMGRERGVRVLYYLNKTAYQLADARRATDECPTYGPEYRDPISYGGMDAFKKREAARLASILDWVETGESSDPDVKNRVRWHDFHYGFSADVHNARSSKDTATQKQLQRLARIMFKNKVGSVRKLVELAQKKWDS